MKSSKSCLLFTVAIYFVAPLLLVVASIIIRKGEDVLWVNGNHTPLLDRFFSTITDLGAGLLFIPLVGCLLFVRFRFVVLAILVWAGHGIVCAILKRGFFGYLKRPREVLDNSLLHFVPNVDVHSYFSFPSGHSATIFCLAFLASLFLKNRIASISFLLIALLVGYSRIYLLEHFLMDVAGGAAIGIIFTYMLWRYFETAKLPGWMNNYLKINPDLSLKVFNG
jgi:membrane-associated phospholipid phosphatase